MTFAVANDLMGYWAFGEQFCETWIAFDVMCCTASIVNLSVIRWVFMIGLGCVIANRAA